VFVPAWPFQPSEMFASRGAPERCSSRSGFGLTKDMLGWNGFAQGPTLGLILLINKLQKLATPQESTLYGSTCLVRCAKKMTVEKVCQGQTFCPFVIEPPE
jgi:hypothetical protein